MKKVVILVLSLFFLFVPHVFAQDSGWVIENFHADINIKKSGEVQIVEKLDVDFRNQYKHGIFRDIPYIYNEKNGSQYYTDITIQQVVQDGTPATYAVLTNGDFKEIKIGDSDRTISGKHIYQIVYIAKGVLRGFGNYDEFYWNVTGNNWPVFIDHASAAIHLPEGIRILDQSSCYQGEEGSKTPCTYSQRNDSSIDFTTTGLLGSDEGMTVAVPYQSHKIPLLTVARPKSFIEKLFYPIPLLVFLFIAILGSIWVIRQWWRNGRDPSIGYETLVVEYTPPEKLRPAEIGVLMDEKADTLDITSTIIDLTTRGYLTITEVPKKWLFGKTDYVLKTTNKDESSLLSYESLLLEKLFEDREEVKVSSLKNTFYKDLAQVKTAVYAEMVKKGLFTKSPETVRNTYFAFGIGGIVLASILLSAAASVEYVTIFTGSLGMMAASVVLVIFSRFMGQRSVKGREIYRRIRGYKEFINTAERYRQRFFEKKDLFNEVLPYAIVFGLTGKFAQAMKDIGLENPQIHGYYGTSAFNAYAFTHTVNDFSNSFSSAAASAPSSSGSGGGGSSGGGFGGGGGGSW